MALTVCRIPGCPAITQDGICPTHSREVDRKRGSRQQRGYGREHEQTRRRLAPQVATGKVACARCGKLITTGEPWDLGHDETRKHYRGPEHVRCNRATMGRERQT